MQNTETHFSVAGQMNSMNDSTGFQQVESSNDSKFSFHAEPRQTLAAWHMEYIWIASKRFGIQFSTFDPEIIFKEFTLAHHKENKDPFLKQQGQEPLSPEMTSQIKAQFQCRRLQEGRRLRVLLCW